jgi:putative drug exporter of the RND superfamily
VSDPRPFWDLVGGPTAQQKDFDTAAAHDNRLIVPIVLLLVFVILALLLRAGRCRCC